MLTLIALSALLVQDPPAPPAPPEVRTRVMVMGPHGTGTLDKDGDGQVSREEFAAPMNEHFAVADKDGDGRLSTEELAAGHHGPGSDENVLIFRGGVDGAPGPHRFEIRRPHGAEGGEVREIIVRGLDGHDMPHIIHGAGHGPGTRFEVRHAGDHAEMDKDGDGRISEVEFISPLREAFGRMDADRSGFIETGERGGDGDVRVFTHRIETHDRED